MPRSKTIRLLGVQPQTLDLEDAIEQIQITAERATVMLEALRREIEPTATLDHLLSVAEESLIVIRARLSTIAQHLAGPTPMGAA